MTKLPFPAPSLRCLFTCGATQSKMRNGSIGICLKPPSAFAWDSRRESLVLTGKFAHPAALRTHYREKDTRLVPKQWGGNNGPSPILQVLLVLPLDELNVRLSAITFYRAWRKIIVRLHSAEVGLQATHGTRTHRRQQATYCRTSGIDTVITNRDVVSESLIQFLW